MSEKPSINKEVEGKENQPQQASVARVVEGAVQQTLKGEAAGEEQEAEHKNGLRRLQELGVVGSPEDADSFIKDLNLILVRSDIHGTVKEEIAKDWIGKALDSTELDNEQIRLVLSHAFTHQLISEEVSQQMFEQYAGKNEAAADSETEN